MAEDFNLEDPIEPIEPTEPIEIPEGDDDTAKLFAKFGVDPNNADTDDLLRILQRAEKAEKLIIEKKKAEKANPKVAPTQETSVDLETRLFFVENESARPYKDEFLKVREQYPTLSFDDALELAKTRKPKESKTVKEGFQGGGYTQKPKALEQMSEEEALNLPPEQHFQWMKKTGKIM